MVVRVPMPSILNVAVITPPPEYDEVPVINKHKHFCVRVNDPLTELELQFERFCIGVNIATFNVPFTVKLLLTTTEPDEFIRMHSDVEP